MSQVLTPIMIIENTQLGKVVSILKGLERHFYDEDEKSIFAPQSWTSSPFFCVKAKGFALFQVKNRFFFLSVKVAF